MRPPSGILSTQLVLRIGRRVADHRIYQSELSALKLLRLTTSTLAATKPSVPGVGGSHEVCPPQRWNLLAIQKSNRAHSNMTRGLIN